MNGKCWRGDLCAYLHKREDFRKNADKENISATDITTPEHLAEDLMDTQIPTINHNVDVTNHEIHQNYENLENDENYDADTSNEFDESIDTIMAKAMAFNDLTESESEKGV